MSIRDYDKNGNCIRERFSNGRIKRYEYNSKGQLIHIFDSTGYNAWYGYDENGEEAYYRNSNGHEEGNRKYSPI